MTAEFAGRANRLEPLHPGRWQGARQYLMQEPGRKAGRMTVQKTKTKTGQGMTI
jgi:hypothetical protein